MPHQNADHIEDNSILNFDLCIIGSGAAGITLAREFLHSDISVILLEAGGPTFEEDLQADYDYSLQNDLRGPWKYTRTRVWGGSTAAWYGRCTQLQPIDFEKRDWVNNSGWPLPYQEVQHYIDRALTALKVKHREGICPSYWEQSKTMQAFTSSEISPNIFLWSDPKKIGLVYESEIVASPNIHLCTYAYVQELIPNPNNDHIESVNVRSLSGKRFKVKPRMVIVAGGGIENARLLLLSQHRSTNGVGNEFDNVGRYYMDHPRLEGMGKLRINFENKNWFQMIQHLDESMMVEGNMQILLTFTEQLQRKRELLNHGTVLKTIYKEALTPAFLAAKKIFYSKKNKSIANLSPSDYLTAGLAFPHLVKTGFKRFFNVPLNVDHLILVDQLEQEPDRESRVQLNSEKDRFGQNKVTINWKIGRSTLESARILHQLIDQHVRQMKLGWIDSPLVHDREFEPKFTDACHPIGTTRMSSHPKDGVVDNQCQVHGIDNLFIAGSSVFPTSSYANPTLTLVALSIRLADKIKTDIKNYAPVIKSTLLP